MSPQSHTEASEKIGQLKMAAPDGKQRFTDFASTETGILKVRRH